MTSSWMRNCMAAVVASVVTVAANPAAYDDMIKRAESIAPMVQKAIDGKKGPEAADNAQKLGAVMAEVQAFLAQQNKAEGADHAKAAGVAANEVAAAASAGDFDKASEAWRKVLDHWAKVPKTAS